MGEIASLKVTVKRKLMKYAEGADPAVDQPISVDIKEVVLQGAEAQQALQEIGVNKDTAINIATSIQGGGQ